MARGILGTPVKGKVLSSVLGVATNLIFSRPIKTKQLLLYGEPSTQKTLILKMLDQVLNIYHASTRKNDFSGVCMIIMIFGFSMN